MESGGSCHIKSVQSPSKIRPGADTSRISFLPEAFTDFFPFASIADHCIGWVLHPWLLVMTFAILFDGV
jgi:hypothetical protein